MAVWNSEEVLNFIDLYQNEPIIWNPKHEQHKNKNKVSNWLLFVNIAEMMP